MAGGQVIATALLLEAADEDVADDEPDEELEDVIEDAAALAEAEELVEELHIEEDCWLEELDDELEELEEELALDDAVIVDIVLLADAGDGVINLAP